MVEPLDDGVKTGQLVSRDITLQMLNILLPQQICGRALLWRVIPFISLIKIEFLKQNVCKD